MAMMSSIEKIEDLIASNKIEPAIYELFELTEGTDYHDDLIAASSHYLLLKQNEIRGTSLPEEMTKLKYRLLGIKNELRNYIESFSNESKKVNSDLFEIRRAYNEDENFLDHKIFKTSFDKIQKIIEVYDSPPLGVRKDKITLQNPESRLERLRKLDSLEFGSLLMNKSKNEIQNWYDTNHSKNDNNIVKLEGVWESQWNRIKTRKTFLSNIHPVQNWHIGKGKINVTDNKLQISCYDESQEYVIIAIHIDNRLLGRYMSCRNEDDTSPFFGIIKDSSEINGHWAFGKWLFKR